MSKAIFKIYEGYDKITDSPYNIVYLLLHDSFLKDNEGAHDIWGSPIRKDWGLKFVKWHQDGDLVCHATSTKYRVSQKLAIGGPEVALDLIKETINSLKKLGLGPKDIRVEY